MHRLANRIMAVLQWQPDYSRLNIYKRRQAKALAKRPDELFAALRNREFFYWLLIHGTDVSNRVDLAWELVHYRAWRKRVQEGSWLWGLVPLKLASLMHDMRYPRHI